MLLPMIHTGCHGRGVLRVYSRELGREIWEIVVSWSAGGDQICRVCGRRVPWPDLDESRMIVGIVASLALLSAQICTRIQCYYIPVSLSVFLANSLSSRERHDVIRFSD
ncbi:hypothetical protein BT67DRAFT_251587 [Trichocladium antarcticum]|uniref:Uncharacterized protein n=1 Tax=Trichocladium antarcticum TaxID=1450529 RepID=A0AAN6UC29_9PEZI|nr:hypothetical protein BT67DRAFT_251587 [Trichocladium antarcticum]